MNLIFAGPTITYKEINQYKDCICLPPVRQGDILKHLSKKPISIGIIDGYFEGAPAIWHKEILYALDQGVYVYGSSSMGALRAAELHSFGMQGVGQIFEWYRDGVITDDDEVAVLHGPEETQYLTASEPMVNIRATLDLASREQIINRSQQKALLTAAKNTFYKKRSWRSLMENLQGSISDELSTKQFLEWVQLNKLDLKKQDAIQLLQTIQNAGEKHTNAYSPDFYFEWTNVWDAAYQQYSWNQRDTKPVVEHQQVLDQLRLKPDKYERYRDKAILGSPSDLSVAVSISETDLKKELALFKTANQLRTRSELLSHLERIKLDEASLVAMLEDSARARQRQHDAGDVPARIIRQLIFDGYYVELLKIVESKHELLLNDKLDLQKEDPLPAQILAWYFGHRLNTSIPKNLEAHLSRVDFTNADDFYRLIRTDYLYWREQG